MHTEFTIVIPFWNGHQYLDRLLASIPESIPVILVDDLSDKPLSDIGRPNTQIIRLAKKGYFTGAVNSGIEACNTDVLILNQDTYFADNSWLNFIQDNRNQYGLFGESAGNHPAWPNRYIHGTFMYIRRDVIDAVGLMDAENYPLWGSTCEYQLRACRKGFQANPAKVIPGFVHKRRGPHGSAIQQSLKLTGQRGKFIRTPPWISVVITCYNHGKYLQEAINSLIGGQTFLKDMPGQSFQSFEIVIVDDGSEDDSALIAEKLADPWKGIHFVSQSNKGSASAMNTGIQASHARHGGLIAPLDGDDMMEPQRLETMLKALEENPHSVIFDNMRYFANDRYGVVLHWQNPDKIKDHHPLGNHNFEQLLQENQMHKGLLYPKKAWVEVGGYPETMTKGREDWAFNVGLGIKGWCGVNTGEYHYLYRRELQNRTLKNTSPKHHQFFLSQIKSLYPHIYAGERPKMCCGKPSASNGKSSASMAVRYSKDLPGQDGMVILEYAGGNAGDLTWHGPVTRTTYILGGAKKRGYVDKRDAHGDGSKRIAGMLALKKNGKPIFIEIEALQIPETQIIFDVDLLLKTVKGLEKGLLNLSEQQLEKALQVEKSEKKRASAIKAIERQLERVA